MNFLKTDINGGFPFVLDDLRFADASIRKALTDLVIGLNGGGLDCIVLGVEVTGPGALQDVSAGLLLVDGELIQVDAHTVGTIDIADYQKITIVETADAAGNKTFEDTNVHDTYIKRRVVLEAGFDPAPGGTKKYRTSSGGYQFDRLPAAILGELSEFFTNWNLIAGADISGLPALVTYWLDLGIQSKKVGKTARININVRLLNAAGAIGQITMNGPSNIEVSDTTFIGFGVCEETPCTFILTTSGVIQIEKIDGSDFVSGAPIKVYLNSGDFPCNL